MKTYRRKSAFDNNISVEIKIHLTMNIYSTRYYVY